MQDIKAEIIRKVKLKRELSDISDAIVNEVLEKEIKKHNILLENLRKSSAKQLVKYIRASLRIMSGQFISSNKERMLLLKQDKISSLLRTHSSTRERMDFYPEIKKMIQKLSIKSILDLGCGLNPIALASSGIIYHAADIKSSELELVKEYFKVNNINGSIFLQDLRKINSDLPEADLCLMLKVLDVIEKNGHKLAEQIIRHIKSKYLLISFSTKTLSGKSMKHPQRGWIERLLGRLGFSYKTFSSKNEIFYLAEKSPCSC